MNFRVTGISRRDTVAACASNQGFGVVAVRERRFGGGVPLIMRWVSIRDNHGSLRLNGLWVQQ